MSGESNVSGTPTTANQVTNATDSNQTPIAGSTDATALPPGMFVVSGQTLVPLRSVAARGDAASFSPATDAPLSGAEARADAAPFSPSVTPDPGALSLSSDPPTVGVNPVALSGGRIFNESVSESMSAADTTDATPIELQGRIDLNMTTSSVVTLTPIAPLWEGAGIDRAQIDRAESYLLALKAFAEAQAAMQSGPPGIGHNTVPPAPDILSIQIALSVIPLLRKQIVEGKPDLEILNCIWLGLSDGMREVAKFASWVAENGTRKAGEYIDIFIKEFLRSAGKSMGTARGVTGWVALSSILVNPHGDIQLVAEAVKAVATSLGFHVG